MWKLSVVDLPFRHASVLPVQHSPDAAVEFHVQQRYANEVTFGTSDVTATSAPWCNYSASILGLIISAGDR